MRNYVTTYDPFFDLFFDTGRSNKYDYIMDTDVIDKKDHFEMLVNLPNVEKENVKVSLEDGYLTIEASLTNNKDNDEDNYVIREREYGNYSRSFYVGDYVKMSDISAKLNKGVLSLNIKKPSKEEIEKDTYIQIN